MKRYSIHSETLRFDDGQKLKGFRREHFEDACRRYLPPVGDLTRGIRGNQHEQRNSDTSRPVAEPPFATDSDQGSNPHEYSDATRATGETPQGGAEGARPLPPGLRDEMYPVLLADAARDGDITETEFEERYALHKLVLGEKKSAA